MGFSLANFFSNNTPSSGMKEIFPFPCKDNQFYDWDVKAIYKKILHDCVERSDGIPAKYEHALFDNCVQSNAQSGLITLLSSAMFSKCDLYIVYKNDVIRVADENEKAKIKADYEKMARSSLGVYISFKNYTKTDVLKIYSALEYYTTASLYKQVNISKAVQLKMSDMRKSINLNDASVTANQAQEIIDAISYGKSVLIDAGDSIECPTVDVSPIEKAILFCNQKKASILGMPIAYVSGELTAGIGSSGEADARQIERGLKEYFYGIIKPVLQELFGIKITFKSQDFRMLDSALNALRTFEVTSEDIMPSEMKLKVVASLFGINQAELIKAAEAEKKLLEKSQKVDVNFEEHA